MNEDLEWKPQPEGLQQIIQLLKESQSIDNTIQKNVQKVNTHLISSFDMNFQKHLTKITALIY